MINLYPSFTEHEPAESHGFTGTLGEFFDSQLLVKGKRINWRDRPIQPVAVSVNGAPVPANRWDTTQVTPDDDVQVRLIPRGGIVNFIRKVDPLMNLIMKSLTPKQQQQGSSQSGQKLETSSATANVARLNEVVPELAGRHIRYPDYLKAPIRYFTDPRTQMLEMLLCVGPGQYQINPDEIKIGETTVTNLGEEVEYRIFQPNEDMTGHPASECYYVAPEVGGTSNGSAGLEIATEYTGSEDGGLVASSFAFNANQITITAPVDGHWPSGMQVGSRISSVLLPQPYDVTKRILEPGQPDTINRFTGDLRELLPFSLGDRIATDIPGLTGAFISAGDLDINGNGWIELESSTGNPIDSVPVGTRTIAFTSGDPHYYQVTAISGMTVTVQKYIRILPSPNYLPVAGWPGFNSVTSSSATVQTDSSSFAGDWTGPLASTPKNEKSTLTILDFFFRGLGVVSDDGSIESHTVTLQIEFRERGTSNVWNTVTQSFTNNTVDDVGYSVPISHAYIAPEFRVRRTGVGDADSNTYETCVWYGMRAHMVNKTVYPWTTLYLKIKSGGVVAANSESKINLIATRMLPVMQPGGGVYGDPVPTSDISAFVVYIANSIGYDQTQIDMDELLRLHNIWTARGDTFNHVFDQTTVKEAINTVLGAGMAEMTVEGGVIRPVRDEPRTVFEQPYSPQNMTGPLKRTWKSKRHDDFDGVDVEYMDENTWTKETVKCRLPSDLGAKVETIKLSGVTNRDRAWRIGMRRRRELKYRIWNYSFATEMDALNSRYLSYVPLIDNIEGYGKSCILVSITASGGQALLQVTEPLQWETGAQHVVAYRNPEGKLVGPFNATPGPSPYHVLAPIPTPWPVVTLKHEPPHVYFGPQDKWTFPALITGVTPNGREAVSVTGVNYAPQVYLDDDNFAPAE